MADRGAAALGRRRSPTTLVEKLNRADEQAHAPDPGPPLVGPPLYGGTHARQPRIETEAPADAAQPQWFRELNLDPRHRIVGGLGTRVVQAEQEDLMPRPGTRSSASRRPTARCAWRSWPSTSARRCTAATVAAHRRRGRRRSPSACTPRCSTRRSAASGRRSRARACRASVTAGAFRRLARVRGPVVRAAVAARGAARARRRGADRARRPADHRLGARLRAPGRHRAARRRRAQRG